MSASGRAVAEDESNKMLDEKIQEKMAKTVDKDFWRKRAGKVAETEAWTGICYAYEPGTMKDDVDME
jgi:hypothetical protein